MTPSSRARLLVLAALQACAAGQQPNPPQWPDSVRVFGPETPSAEIVSYANWAFNQNGGADPVNHGQFSSGRFAMLFRPGSYAVDIPVGFYTQVLGLGFRPQDVVFSGPKGVFCEEGDQSSMGGALSTFWRGAENFQQNGDMLWAVSQAAPLRRLMVTGSLNLAEYVHGVGMGYSSGGFLANVFVQGKINSASQQQWFTRNADVVQHWDQALWNMVFVGTKGAPESHCGHELDQLAVVNVPATEIIAEKPFITIDAPSGQYFLQIPGVQRGRVGSDFDSAESIGRRVDFGSVFVARDTDSAATINEHLAQGRHVVLSPGIYQLEAALEVSHDGQVVLGLGLATLVAANGGAAIHVHNVGGVRIAGVLLQAGPGATDALLQWGDGAYPGDDANPGFLHDVFARVGGPTDSSQEEVRARVMVRISSGHVVGDNLWLWRADHDLVGEVAASRNPCDHGLVVEGDHVTMYGLAVEHTLKDLVQWSGDDGATYFFQSELPYDVTQENFGDPGYVGYRVTDAVTSHRGYGVAVYHFFRDFPVTVQSGIHAPPWLENSFQSPLSVYLTGKGTVLHVINDKGESTSEGNQASWHCSRGPEVAPNPVSTSRSRSSLPPADSKTEAGVAVPTLAPGWVSTSGQSIEPMQVPDGPMTQPDAPYQWGGQGDVRGLRKPWSKTGGSTSGWIPAWMWRKNETMAQGERTYVQVEPTSGGKDTFSSWVVTFCLLQAAALGVAGLYLWSRRRTSVAEAIAAAMSPLRSPGYPSPFGKGPSMRTLSRPHVSPEAASAPGAVAPRTTPPATPGKDAMQWNWPCLSPGAASARTMSAAASPAGSPEPRSSLVLLNHRSRDPVTPNAKRPSWSPEEV